jgi:phosphoserine phosphatase SerB
MACAAEPPAGGQAQSLLVFRGWGLDAPGIANAFLAVVDNHNCRVVDVGQFLLEGFLMFTFVVQVNEKDGMVLMKDLEQCSKSRNMKLDFHFPDSREVAVEATSPASPGSHSGNSSKNGGVAVLSVVSTSPITPGLLYDIDGVLCEHGCVVHDIRQRHDNKKCSGEYNKVELQLRCPPGVTLATLHMGVPLASGGMTDGVQKVAWDHGAEVALRWWDAMNRPIGKSLVVFGLSQVLCPCNILDVILREAGLDPADAGSEDGSEWQVTQKKVAMLKGQHLRVFHKVKEHLIFTPGAKMVCTALKRMGFRLAILTNTSPREIAEFAQTQLGMDYVICRDLESVDGFLTGSYSQDHVDVNFRKVDLLQLMAEREGIDFRNVITVGQPLLGLKKANARLVLDTFGPSVYFNSHKMKDLTIVLYLLGFNGADIVSLRKRRWEDGPGAEAQKASPADEGHPSKRFLVQVSSRFQTPGQLRQILSSLQPFQSDLHVSTVTQCSLEDGGMCMGLDLRVQNTTHPDQVAKELFFACQRQGFQVMDVPPRAPNCSVTDTMRNRHVITLVQHPHISTASLRAAFGVLAKNAANCVTMERLSVSDLSAMQFVVSLPEGLGADAFAQQLAEVSQKEGVDIAFQRDDLDRWMRRLVVFDMDSTLIQQEVIDELAKYAGVEQEVKEITEAAMRGELNFFDSLKARVGLLKGYKAEELYDKVKAKLLFTPGAKKLCKTLRQLGYKMAVISGGFLPMAQEVQRHLGLDYAFANSLEVDEAGRLTGCTSGPVVTPQRKRALLATIANVEGCDLKQTIAVGDGANDIPMLNAAGLGIAFCAKPKVQEATEFRINHRDLSTVLFLIGVSEHAADRLAPKVVPPPAARSPSAEGLCN